MWKSTEAVVFETAPYCRHTQSAAASPLGWTTETLDAREHEPHLFFNIQTAVRTTQVSPVWINSTLGMSAQSLRQDRVLDEALAQDILRICDLFGLSVPAAERFLNALDHPSFMAPADNSINLSGTLRGPQPVAGTGF
jgi:hypothetical protein